MRGIRRSSPSGRRPKGIVIRGMGRAVVLLLAGLLAAGCAGAAATTAPLPANPGVGSSGPGASAPVTGTPAARDLTTAAPSAEMPGTGFPLTLTDDQGTVVHLAGVPRRVISLTPAVTETLFALGAGAKLVGGTDGDDYPPQARTLPHVVIQTRVQIEKIVALQPDLVFAGGDGFTPEADVQRLRSLGIPVVVLYAPTVAGVLHDIQLTGDAVGATGTAQALTREMQREIDAIHQAAVAGGTAPRTLYEIDATKQIFLPAKDSFVAQMVSLAGGRPITSGDPAVWTISLEQLVAADPQVIVLGDADYGTTVSDVLARPGWGGMTAVRARAIHPVDDTLVTRPGPRLAQGLAALARAIQPTLALPSFAPPPPLGPGSSPTDGTAPASPASGAGPTSSAAAATPAPVVTPSPTATPAPAGPAG